jgi:hypothetical protein
VLTVNRGSTTRWRCRRQWGAVAAGADAAGGAPATSWFERRVLDACCYRAWPRSPGCSASAGERRSATIGLDLRARGDHALRVLVLIALASVIWVPIGVWIGMRPHIADGPSRSRSSWPRFPANLFFPVRSC